MNNNNAFINLQLFADEEEKKPEENKEANAQASDKALSDVITDLQSQLERETKRADSNDAKIVELTKIMRNMSVNTAEEEKPKTLEEEIKEFYGEE